MSYFGIMGLHKLVGGIVVEAGHIAPLTPQRGNFGEAATVFRDPLAFIFDDEDHSEEEYREIIIGHSIRHRLLIVSFTERGDVIRIISARKADRDEREDYENAKR